MLGTVDLDLGCGEFLWISDKWLGFCCGVGLWKSGGIYKRKGFGAGFWVRGDGFGQEIGVADRIWRRLGRFEGGLAAERGDLVEEN